MSAAEQSYYRCRNEYGGHQVEQAKLNAIARKLNERPRKTLEYQTPAERFGKCVAAIN